MFKKFEIWSDPIQKMLKMFDLKKVRSSLDWSVTLYRPFIFQQIRPDPNLNNFFLVFKFKYTDW